MRKKYAVLALAWILIGFTTRAAAQTYGGWETIYGSGSGAEGRIEISFAQWDCASKPYEYVPFRWNSTYGEPVKVWVTITFTRCKDKGGSQSFYADLTGGEQKLSGQYIGGLSGVTSIRVDKVRFPRREAAEAAAKKAQLDADAQSRVPQSAAAPKPPAASGAGAGSSSGGYSPQTQSASNRQSSTSSSSSGYSAQQQAQREQSERADREAAARRARAEQQAQAQQEHVRQVNEYNRKLEQQTNQRIQAINNASQNFNRSIDQIFGNTPEQRAAREAEEAEEERQAELRKERERLEEEEQEREQQRKREEAERRRRANEEADQRRRVQLTERNQARANALESKAANDLATADELYELASLYSGSQYLPQDAERVVRYRKAAAEMGNAQAQFEMGNLAIQAGLDTLAAMDWYRRAAEQGHANAQNDLAAQLDARKQHAEAAGWFTKAAQAKLPVAMNNLASYYLQGKGVAKDTAAAVRWFEAASAEGYTSATFTLAAAYRLGWYKLSKNWATAAKLYEKITYDNRRGGEASYALATMAYYGDGAAYPRDRYAADVHLTSTIRWYEKKSRDWYQKQYFWRQATYMLAKMYYEGWIDTVGNPGVTMPTLVELPREGRIVKRHRYALEANAVKMVRELDEAGMAQGTVLLAKMLITGLETGSGKYAYSVLTANPQKAVELLTKVTAAKNPPIDAFAVLGELYATGANEMKPDPERAQEALSTAVARFDEAHKRAPFSPTFFPSPTVQRAMVLLGELYEKGKVVTQDYAKAAELYQKAARAQNAEACERLAALYKSGKGLPKDSDKAKEYKELARRYEIFYVDTR